MATDPYFDPQRIARQQAQQAHDNARRMSEDARRRAEAASRMAADATRRSLEDSRRSREHLADQQRRARNVPPSQGVPGGQKRGGFLRLVIFVALVALLYVLSRVLGWIR